MPAPAPLLTDDPAANRRVWAEQLRRPDWNLVPHSGGRTQECPNPWEVGYAIAFAYWPSSAAVREEVLDVMDIEDEIMLGCYGLGDESGAFDPAELPDRIRRIVLMVAQSARSAPPYPARDEEDARDILAGLPGDDRWNLYMLSSLPITLWEYDPSPMRGAVLAPAEVARLIADILDAAPPSLLAPPDDPL